MSLFPFSTKFLLLSQHHLKSYLYWLPPFTLLPAQICQCLPCPGELTSQGHCDLHVSKCSECPRLLLTLSPGWCTADRTTVSPLGFHSTALFWFLSFLLLGVSILHHWILNTRISLTSVLKISCLPFYPIFLGDHTRSWWLYIYHLLC